MDKAKKQYEFSVSTSTVYILLVSLAVICIVIGCSSKKDKDKQGAEKSNPAKTGANIPSTGKVSQLPKSPILPLPDANRTARKTNTPPKGEVSINTLRKEYNRADSSERKIELLQFMPDGAIDRDPCAIGMAQTAVADADGNVALAGIELVQGSNRPEVLPVVAKAMLHPDEEVRRMAVGLLSDIDVPQTGDLLIAALSDESKDVRDAALEIAGDKDEKVKFKVLEKGISCSYGDTKEDSVAMLESAGGHRAVDILIEALQDKDAKFCKEVTSAISTLIDMEFTSYEEAKTWWEKNKNKYDEDLSLK
jgi:hypothetical protein